MSHTARKARLLEIAGPCTTPLSGELQPLIHALQTRFGDQLMAVVFYGSCLRGGDLYSGLLDFYVIVQRYSRAHGHPLSAFFNAMIPPNVYYLEADGAGGRLRAKYAVLSMGQLENGCENWFQSGVWGRFAQPLAVVYAANPVCADQVRAASGEAVVSLLRRALPRLTGPHRAGQAYAQALALSYGSELRVEGKARSADLVAGLREEYERRWHCALPLLPFASDTTAEGLTAFRISKSRRVIAQLAWPLRQTQGKLLSVLRLVKACFTFTGAIDYAAWKLERHTGQTIEVTPRLRRHPLIFGWPVLWRLYRRRVLH